MIEIHYVSWARFLFYLLLREVLFILITLSFVALGGMIESFFCLFACLFFPFLFCCFKSQDGKSSESNFDFTGSYDDLVLMLSASFPSEQQQGIYIIYLNEGRRCFFFFLVSFYFFFGDFILVCTCSCSSVALKKQYHPALEITS